jgi:hypothetical protein
LDRLVSKITDFTNLLEFGALTKLLEFPEALLSPISQSWETVFAPEFVPGGFLRVIQYVKLLILQICKHLGL